MFSFINHLLINVSAPFLREEVKLLRGQQVIEEAIYDEDSIFTLGEGRRCMKSKAEPEIYCQIHKLDPAPLPPLQIFSSSLAKSVCEHCFLLLLLLLLYLRYFICYIMRLWILFNLLFSSHSSRARWVYLFSFLSGSSKASWPKWGTESCSFTANGQGKSSDPSSPHRHLSGKGGALTHITLSSLSDVRSTHCLALLPPRWERRVSRRLTCTILLLRVGVKGQLPMGPH